MRRQGSTPLGHTESVSMASHAPRAIHPLSGCCRRLSRVSLSGSLSKPSGDFLQPCVAQHVHFCNEHQ